MQVPLKITFRNVRKTPDIEALIDKQAAKLERVCNHLVSCHMAVEKPQEHQRTGNPFRVRIDVTVPPQHELVVIRDASEGDLHERLPTVLRGAFDVMRRQIKKLAEKQRKQVKTHPEQEVGGFVSLLLRKEAYGFITSLDSREIYFHKNSLPAGEFDRLEIGTGVHWVEQQGKRGRRPAPCGLLTSLAPGPASRAAVNESKIESIIGVTYRSTPRTRVARFAALDGKRIGRDVYSLTGDRARHVKLV